MGHVPFFSNGSFLHQQSEQSTVKKTTVSMCSEEIMCVCVCCNFKVETDEKKTNSETKMSTEYDDDQLSSFCPHP